MTETDEYTEAITRAVIMYRQPLILFLNSFIHNTSAAEDAASDAFAEVFFRKIDPDTPGFKTYLYKTAKSRAISSYRHFGREVPVDMPADDADMEQIEQTVLETEQNRALYSALSKLKREYRAALYLVYIENMSYAEAGRVIGKSEKQMKNLVYRAKPVLKEQLMQEGFEYEDQ